MTADHITRAAEVLARVGCQPDGEPSNLDQEYEPRWKPVCSELLDEVQRLRAGIEAHHRPVEIEPSETICGHCSWQMPNGRFFGQVVEWPCPTAALIDPTEGENR